MNTSISPQSSQSSDTEGTESVQCFKHYCRACHAVQLVDGNKGGAKAEYPRCGKPMAYLGTVTGIPSVPSVGRAL